MNAEASKSTQESIMQKDSLIDNMDQENRWIILAGEIHWEKLISRYLLQHDFEKIHPLVSPRTIIAAFIIKYKLKLSSRATVQLINENQYLQVFSESGKYYNSPPLTPELMRNIRDIFGQDEWASFKHVILNESYSTFFGKWIYKMRNRMRETKITTIPVRKPRHVVLDTELHESIGLQYNADGSLRSAERKHRSKTKKLKKKARSVLDIIIWTVLIGLVIGSLSMIIYESEWKYNKKKTEKNK